MRAHISKVRTVLSLCTFLCCILASSTRTAAATAPITPRTAATDWDEWYLPTADKACTLYVFEIGQGSPVVVVHGGFGSEHSYLLDSVKGLTNQHRFIFYDQRGSLRSPCPLDSVSFMAHIEDLETLRKALGIEKLDIFAHSMGTMITAEYMKDHPDHVGKVVLAGALPMESGSFLGKQFDVSKWKNLRVAGDLMTARPEVMIERESILTEPSGPKRSSHLWHLSFAAASIYHIDRWREVRGGGRSTPITLPARLQTTWAEY